MSTGLAIRRHIVAWKPDGLTDEQLTDDAVLFAQDNRGSTTSAVSSHGVLCGVPVLHVALLLRAVLNPA